MATISISAERMAQLEEFAHRNGQDAPAALDAALADYLEWERSDYQESVEAIRQGYEDFLAGRSMPFEEAFEDLRVKHGLSR
jgi:predicted transcriptional regulator